MQFQVLQDLTQGSATKSYANVKQKSTT